MTPPPPPTYGADSESVRAHLNISQGIISRMANNSANCKTWCVTLVAAILVLVARTDTPVYALIAFVPTILFLFLDAYYLELERYFRGLYNSFVSKLHIGEIELRDLYDFPPPSISFSSLLKVFKRPVIWSFYGAVALAILILFALSLFCA